MENKDIMVGVVGCGTMGSGIASVFSRAGYLTIVNEVNDDVLIKSRETLEKRTKKEVEKGNISKDDYILMTGGVKWEKDLAALEDCDIVIEAIIEKKEEKIALFQRLENICGKECIFASNTSSYSITELGSGLHKKDRILGLHFFYPVEKMKLVEIVQAEFSSEKSISVAKEIVTNIGKNGILVKDTPGFVVNRLLIPYFLDSIKVLEEGLASPEIIDQGMTEGGGFSIGPFRLLDHVGLDTIYYIANSFYDEFKDRRFSAPPLLKRMVLAGKLGRKTGEGFYKYNMV